MERRNQEHLRPFIREVVHETLVALGADPSRPHEMQAKFNFLHNMHKDWITLKRKALCTVVAIVITAAAGAMWAGIQIAVAGNSKAESSQDGK